MKKIFLGTLTVVFVLALSACGSKTAVQSPTSENAQAPVVAQTDNGGVISSIKDAMGLGKKMECTYTNKFGDREISAVTQVDGKNFKSITEVNGKKMYSMMKDNVMYSWSEDKSVATKVDLSCMQDLAKNVPQGQQPPASDQDPQKTFDNASNVSCKPAEAIDISVPSDIEFKDMCETLKGISSKLKDIKVPSGTNIPANIPNIPGGIPPQAQ